MNKLFPRFVMVVILLGLVLAGCGPKPTATPVAVVNDTPVPAEPTATIDPVLAARMSTVIFDIDSGSVADPTLWNPFAASARLDQGLMQAMAEPLFILNLGSPTNEIVNWLGESMTYNADGSVWTVKLRPGITWNDGQPLTADDFLFTVQIGQNTKDLANMPSFDNVASVTKVDDLTLEFTLTTPDFRFGTNTFVARTSTPFFIVPKHVWEGQDATTFTNYDGTNSPVFSGPYTLASASETEFTYVRNDQWWGAVTGTFPLPQPEKLIWTAMGTAETRTAAMSKGDLDSLTAINLGSFLTLQASDPNVIAWTADLPYAYGGDPCVRLLNFNMTKAPWDNVDVRKAVNYAIDRSIVIDIAYEGTTTAADTFLPYGMFKPYVDAATSAGLFTTYPVNAYDPALAKSTLESVGYVMNTSTGYYEKDGVELGMTISNFDDTEMTSATQTIIEQLQAVGINAKQDIQPIPAYIDALTNAGFDTYYFFICGPIDLWSKMDSFSVRHIPEAGGSSSGFYANTERWSSENAVAYSDLVAQMGALPPDSTELTGLFVQAMEYWLKDMPALPIVESSKLTPFTTTYWTNWPTADNPYAAPLTHWPSTLIILTHLEPAK